MPNLPHCPFSNPPMGETTKRERKTAATTNPRDLFERKKKDADVLDVTVISRLPHDQRPEGTDIPSGVAYAGIRQCHGTAVSTLDAGKKTISSTMHSCRRFARESIVWSQGQVPAERPTTTNKKRWTLDEWRDSNLFELG